MSKAGGVVRGSACTAAIIAVGSFSALPVLVVEVAPGDPYPYEPGSQLAALGLERMTSTSAMPGHATGWMVLARPGLDRVDVLTRTPTPEVFFGGTCAISDDWLELAARTGYCVLIIGNIVLIQVPDAAADPMLVARMVDAAGATGLAVGTMAPVYLPGYLSSPKERVWPGRVAYRRPASGRGAQPAPLGFSVALDETDEFGEAVSIVRAEARGMSYEWVRQRLAVELLLRDHLKPPRMVDQVARSIASLSLASRLRRWLRAIEVALVTNWLAVRTITAYILRRPLPHWHIFGMHVIGTCMGGPLLEVVVDPWASELLAVGDADDIEIWLGLKPGGSRADSGAIVAYRGDYRVGILNDDIGVYEAILMEPRHRDTQLLTDGVRGLAADGSWWLRVRMPSGG